MTDEYSVDIYIEWPKEQGGIQRTSIGGNLQALKEESQKALNLAMGAIQGMAYRISRSIRELGDEVRPDEVEVEFSIKMELEGGVVAPFVAKSTTGGQFTVKFKWNIENQPRPQILVRPES